MNKTNKITQAVIPVEQHIFSLLSKKELDVFGVALGSYLRCFTQDNPCTDSEEILVKKFAFGPPPIELINLSIIKLKNIPKITPHPKNIEDIFYTLELYWYPSLSEKFKSISYLGHLLISFIHSYTKTDEFYWDNNQLSSVYNEKADVIGAQIIMMEMDNVLNCEYIQQGTEGIKRKITLKPEIINQIQELETKI